MTDEEAVEVETKHCSACDTDKPLTEFYKNRSRPDGLNSECRVCALARANKWRSDKIEEVGEEEMKRIQRVRTRKHRQARVKYTSRAYNEALKRVRDNHREEFNAYLQEEYDKGGSSN